MYKGTIFTNLQKIYFTQTYNYKFWHSLCILSPMRIILLVLIIGLTSCQKKYCWKCWASTNGKVDTTILCNKTEKDMKKTIYFSDQCIKQ